MGTFQLWGTFRGHAKRFGVMRNVLGSCGTFQGYGERFGVIGNVSGHENVLGSLGMFWVMGNVSEACGNISVLRGMFSDSSGTFESLKRFGVSCKH